MTQDEAIEVLLEEAKRNARSFVLQREGCDGLKAERAFRAKAEEILHEVIETTLDGFVLN